MCRGTTDLSGRLYVMLEEGGAGQRTLLSNPEMSCVNPEMNGFKRLRDAVFRKWFPDLYFRNSINVVNIAGEVHN